VSLNWKEIDLILEELALPGMQIQKVIQGAYDLLFLKLYGPRGGKTLLISLSPGACRLHETFGPLRKSDKPLRFAEFLNARIVNGRIEEALQLGDNRVVRLGLRRGTSRFRLYLRLWSNAANVILTGEEGIILDAMRRLPRRGEIGGGTYRPEESLGAEKPSKEYAPRELPGEGSFNRRIDAFYAEKGGPLSLEALREQVRRRHEGGIDRLRASLERLCAREAEYRGAEKLKEYGDLILANLNAIGPGDEWLEAENFYAQRPEGAGPGSAGGFPLIRIRLDPPKSPAAAAEAYYEEYRRAKNGLGELGAEIRRGEAELARLTEELQGLMEETNPLVLDKFLKKKGSSGAAKGEDAKRPGLSFRRGEWLIMVGRDARENDELLRRHVKGRDLWLHARDFPGSYVFIRQRPGKSFPLEILLDGGNLAIFYSKGRNNGEGDLFYTPVKYLRRPREGPRGLVLPTQEKNLHIRLDETRLRELEGCRIEK
jgi:predicted ribosome quality control (RQC) complex YloA/Tae2 family protein